MALIGVGVTLALVCTVSPDAGVLSCHCLYDMENRLRLYVLEALSTGFYMDAGGAVLQGWLHRGAAGAGGGLWQRRQQ